MMARKEPELTPEEAERIMRALPPRPSDRLGSASPVRRVVADGLLARIDELTHERDRLRYHLQEAAAIHRPDPSDPEGWCKTCMPHVDPYPCPTARALGVTP